MPGKLDRNRTPEVAAQKVHLIGANAIEDLLGCEREVTTRVRAQLSAWDPPRGLPAQLGRVDIVVLEDAIEGRTVDSANLPGEFVGGRQGDAGADLVAPGRSRRADCSHARHGVGAIDDREGTGLTYCRDSIRGRAAPSAAHIANSRDRQLREVAPAPAVEK